MSSYVHVFARKDETFVDLLCYSRSSELYQALDPYAPYAKIAPLTCEQITEAKDELEDRLAIAHEFDDADKELITQIGSWTNTVDEKLEAIDRIQRSIAERKEEMDELEATIHILEFLLCVEADLYAGVECGSDVSVKDIADF